MSLGGRYLHVGDYALTDFNGPGPMTRVQIIDEDRERKHGHSQSGVMFRVTPNLRNGGPDHWYDAYWFEPFHPRTTRAASLADGGNPHTSSQGD